MVAQPRERVIPGPSQEGPQIWPIVRRRSPEFTSGRNLTLLAIGALIIISVGGAYLATRGVDFSSWGGEHIMKPANELWNHIFGIK